MNLRLGRSSLIPGLAAALVGSAVFAPSAPAATSASCPPPSLSVATSSSSTLAAGLVLKAGSVSIASQKIPLHVVTADLTTGSFVARTYANRISDAVTVTQAVQATGALLGINGDFFHITSDGVHLVADGPVSVSGGTVVKGWSKAQPAFVINSATAGVEWVHLAGTVTIVEPHASASARSDLQMTSRVKAKAKAQAKKKTKTKKKKKAKKHRRGVHTEPSRPATQTTTETTPNGSPVTHGPETAIDPGVSVSSTDPSAPSDPSNPGSSTTPGPAYRTWKVTLDGVNDDSTTGPTLFTNGWGSADRSVEEPSSARELDLSDGTVTRNTTSIGSSSPASGTTALVVAGSSASALSSVPTGSTVTTTYAMVDDAGNRVSQLIGGNAVLVNNGSVQDYQCTLEGDNVARPRVAIGVNAARTKIIVGVTDGDGTVAGVTLRQMAEVMDHLGADQALNLDAGNSTQLIQRSGSTITQVNTNHQSPPRTVSDSLVFVANS